MAFSQRDLKWRFKRLGASRWNMGDMGCTVTSLAWLMNQQGFRTHPGMFCDWLNKNNGFTSGGLIKHDSVARYTNGKFRWQEGEGRLQLVVVKWGNIFHWVADADGGFCDDPYDGKRKLINQPYWSITPRRVHIG